MFNIEEELKKLPDQPGVYLMKDEDNQTIYVGKAINLKNRVKQYFQSSRNHSLKVKKMVQNIRSFEYIVTRSEMEALVLECNFIKKYNPKYNIRLKDDKHYPYIKLNIKDAFPKLTIVRHMKKDGGKYFGPYTDVQAMWELVDIIKQTWALRTCSRNLPKDIGKERPCLNYHIGKCYAPCAGHIDQAKYSEMVEEVEDFLSGKYNSIIKKLQDDMQKEAEQLNFEKAAALRDQIHAIKKLEQKQNATTNSMADQDIIAFAKSPEDTLIQVYFVRQGKLVGREHFYLEDTEDETIETIFRDFIVQFYADATFIPKEIIIERVPYEMDILESYLTAKKGSKVKLIIPQKGTKHGILELASKNAELTFGRFGEHLKQEEQKTTGALSELKEALGFKKTPYRIEAYDISNTQGIQSVGGMVVFEGGKPKKSDYRKFKIKSVVGANDYGSIEEVIERRILRMRNEQEENSFTKVPDVFFIDGGKGQVSAAEKIVTKHGLNIPVCGMVKDDKHRTRGLLYKEKEVVLLKQTEGFKLIARIQDEVHRFSIEYHKKLRSKAQIQSVLDDIKGIGKERKKALIQHFGSVERLSQATLQEIQEAPGISKAVADNIYAYFHIHA
ncbi:excinuclease ABC subunit UvrC [Cellulosilyticum sp. I15G10I2]|uniref:excinuclease ABC subunit UvrC n=1 Tax=Cellulosilyticum sp. I15G10I2 TaxID=1892843 RepID=UPI00085CD7CF|nr:excinuclease ABC subunit UvrC [Cellulosilyticum sp. I15G10I2]